MRTTRYSYLFDTDSYKVSHYLQYPPGTTSMFSYIESRGGVYDFTLFFGLQYILKEYLSHRVTVKEVLRMEKLMVLHGEPFNKEGWMYIAKKLKGKLPVRIRAVPEGTIVPTHNMLVSIESTDPKVFWIVSWLETLLLRVWYPITVATRGRFIRDIILAALEKSADDPKEEIKFKLQDFGARGVSSQESAMIGGAAALVSFYGTDTIVGMLCAMDYYNVPEGQVAGYSIPASEHSSITSWGKEHEVDAYRNMIKQFCKPGNMVACVSDSYDHLNACAHLWGEALKADIIASRSILVVRPDSGDPATIVLKTLQILDEKFGHTVNSKSYKVLNHVRVIQGDGINEKSIKEIYDLALENGYSATNITCGMGGERLQTVNRDTQKFAMKCSHIYRTVDGEQISVDVFKDPVTDHGKHSKPGRLDLIDVGDFGNHGPEHEFVTVNLTEGELAKFNTACRIVYENGDLLVDDNFDWIRSRANV